MSFVTDTVSSIFGGGDDAPAPPDPYAVADAQGTANLEAARLGATLNRYDQVTPWGNLTWEQAVDAEGLPTDKWTSTTTLDPRAQQLIDSGLDTSLGLTGATNAALGRVNETMAQGLDTSKLPELYNPYPMIDPRVSTSNLANNALKQQILKAGNVAGTDFNYNSLGAAPTADAATRQSVEDAMYQRMTSRLDPQYEQAQAKLESQLTNQGITPGSEAWNTAMANQAMARTDAYQTAMDSSIIGGGAEMERLFGMGMDSRRQGVSELNTMRDKPFQEASVLAGLDTSAGNTATQAINLSNTARASGLDEQYVARNQIMNELNALRTGTQVAQPQFAAQQVGANVAAAPVAQSVYNSYQGDQANYNASVGSQNALMGALGTLGAGYMMMPTA